MDKHRGRSPSAGHSPAHISQASSPAAIDFQDNANPSIQGIGLDSTLIGDDFSSSNSLQSFGINSNNNNNNNNNNINSQFNSASQAQQYPQTSLGDLNFSNNSGTFGQPQSQSHSPYANPQQSNFSQEMLDPNLSNNFPQNDFAQYPPTIGTGELNQSFFLGGAPQQSSQSVNPADIMNDMSSPPIHAAQTPPNMLQPDSANKTSSAQHSPSASQQQFQRSPIHSRNVSLGPESAAFPHGIPPAEWSMMPAQFTNHRRTPSEYSDVSSVAPSPNLVNQDSFDTADQHHSPGMAPQDTSSYQELLNIGNFTLSDPQIQQAGSPGHGYSPIPSPSISPRLDPQVMPVMNQQNSYITGMESNGWGQQLDSNMFSNQSLEQFPDIQQDGTAGDLGQQMVTPEIKFEFAPASRQNSFEPPKSSLDEDALTPPDRGRNRRRALSDPYHSGQTISRPNSPGTAGSGAGSLAPQTHRSLSPLDRSGTTSPSSSRRRQSTSSLPNRDYILGLVDPEYQAGSGGGGGGGGGGSGSLGGPESGATGAGGGGGGPKRVQKHPATFQCTLCTKRFTRAYNLRSHLRTHTDERPFVCTVCGKAFARQHDRKRHEGLHSGEKKFVCKGELKQGGQWGCSRRFARADALGRHFRSEAGRICIKPLLDEEAVERQRLWQEQQQQQQHQQQMLQQQQQQPPPPPYGTAMDAHGFPVDASGNYTLPAALLAQYPALATLSWADIPQGDVLDDELSGRSSFDASGSEYYDEGDEAGYVSGPGTGFDQGQMSEGYGGGGGGVDYASDYGGR